jgi:syndecan 1
VVQRKAAGTAQAAGGAPPARPRSASRPSASGTPVSRTAASGTARRAGAPPDPGPDRDDLDDLARRLLDPVSRLLRAELRRGRERMGRPHDRRR